MKSRPGNPSPYYLLYDAECGVCRWAIAVVVARDVSHRIRVEPLQGAAADLLLARMNPTRRAASWHIVDPEGAVYSAGDAFPVLLRLLPRGRVLASAAVLLRWPVSVAYHVFAKNRHRFSNYLGKDACAIILDKAAHRVGGGVPVEKPVPPYWREFLFLWGAGVLGIIAILPWKWTYISQILPKLPISLSFAGFAAMHVAANGAIVALLTGLGLFFARRVGLGAPLLERWLLNHPVGPDVRKILPPSIALGVLMGGALVLLDQFFWPRMPQSLGQIPEPPVWQAFLASFYGGIVEELVDRLGFFSLFAWLLSRVARTEKGAPTPFALWGANAASALLFGLGHLPATAGFFPLTGLVVGRAIVLNGLAGLLFGYLYWTRGLESSMAAHFTAGIVIRVIVPLASS